MWSPNALSFLAYRLPVSGAPRPNAMTYNDAVYLNACSHSLPDPAVVEAMRAALDVRPDLRSTMADAKQDARHALATLMGTDARRVGIAYGTTMAWRAMMERLPARSGRILVAAHEWGDHVRHLERMAARSGLELDVIPASDG
ncbi:MAG: hypothetical protein AAF615_10090, partial [Pseudomonadota bacterium]